MYAPSAGVRHGNPPVDASLDTVRCNTVFLTITAKPAFMYGGTSAAVSLA
jgi:hypothetical protein